MSLELIQTLRDRVGTAQVLTDGTPLMTMRSGVRLTLSSKRSARTEIKRPLTRPMS